MEPSGAWIKSVMTGSNSILPTNSDIEKVVRRPFRSEFLINKNTNMETVETFTPEINLRNWGGNPHAEMVTSSSGEWVRYSDYKEAILTLKSLLELHDTGSWEGEDPTDLARNVIEKSNI
jgi:hypothetical protein